MIGLSKDVTTAAMQVRSAACLTKPRGILFQPSMTCLLQLLQRFLPVGLHLLLTRQWNSRTIHGLLQRLMELENLLDHQSTSQQQHQPQNPRSADSLANQSHAISVHAVAPALTTFGYLDCVSRLSGQPHKTRSQVTPALAPTTALPATPTLAIRGGRLTTPPFPRETSDYLGSVYEHNIELFLPVLGRETLVKDLVQRLYSPGPGFNDPLVVAECLCGNLCLAVGVAVLASGPNSQLYSEAGSMVRAATLVEWSQETVAVSAASIKHIRSASLNVDNDHGARTTERVVYTIRAVLLLATYCLFMPECGSSRQLLGIADQMLMGRFGSLEISRPTFEMNPNQMPLGLDPQVRVQVEQVYRSFVTLERRVAMAEGLPTGLHSPVAASPPYRDNAVASALCRLVDIEWEGYSEMLAIAPSVVAVETASRHAMQLETIASTTEARLDEWLGEWDKAIKDHDGVIFLDGSSYIHWLSTYGRVLQYQVIHKTIRNAICLSRADDSRAPQTSSLGLNLASTARSLLDGMMVLLFQPRARPASGIDRQPIPTIYPCTWLWSLQIFDLALTATLVSKQPHAAAIQQMTPAITQTPHFLSGSVAGSGGKTHGGTSQESLNHQDRDPEQIIRDCTQLLLACRQNASWQSRILVDAMLALM